MTDVLAFKQAVMALIQSVPAFGSVQVTWGLPPGQPEREWVFLGDAEWEVTDWVNLRAIEETTAVHVIINAQIPAGDAKAAEARVCVLAAELRAAQLADPTLGAVVWESTYLPLRLRSGPVPDGYAADFELRIRAKYRTNR